MDEFFDTKYKAKPKVDDEDEFAVQEKKVNLFSYLHDICFAKKGDLTVKDPSLKQFTIEHRFSHRWMPGTRIEPDSPIAQAVAGAAERVLVRPPTITGSPFPCDLFIFNHFGIPGVVFGPGGANGHGSDEYVEIDSLLQLTKILSLSIVQFCGLS